MNCRLSANAPAMSLELVCLPEHTRHKCPLLVNPFKEISLNQGLFTGPFPDFAFSVIIHLKKNMGRFLNREIGFSGYEGAYPASVFSCSRHIFSQRKKVLAEETYFA
jgi:hypothetical protein